MKIISDTSYTVYMFYYHFFYSLTLYTYVTVCLIRSVVGMAFHHLAQTFEISSRIGQQVLRHVADQLALKQLETGAGVSKQGLQEEVLEILEKTAPSSQRNQASAVGISVNPGSQAAFSHQYPRISISFHELFLSIFSDFHEFPVPRRPVSLLCRGF